MRSLPPPCLELGVRGKQLGCQTEPTVFHGVSFVIQDFWASDNDQSLPGRNAKCLLTGLSGSQSQHCLTRYDDKGKKETRAKSGRQEDSVKRFSLLDTCWQALRVAVARNGTTNALSVWRPALQTGKGFFLWCCECPTRYVRSALALAYVLRRRGP